MDAWLLAVKTSQIRDLQGFVLGIERDKAAVVAGLTLSYSNGPIEGQINRLKYVKRSMYGRGSFHLLRQRFLQAA